MWDLDATGVLWSLPDIIWTRVRFCLQRVHTRWNNLVPIKLNILNLRDKCVDIVFVLCPVCLEVGGVFKSFVYCFPASFPSLESHCKVLGD